MERAGPVLAALGPEGYKVLPSDILGLPGTGTADAVRCRICSTIRERSDGYETLIHKIRSGDIGYEHFGPILVVLLPPADPEVRRTIQEEMDGRAFWNKVEGGRRRVLTASPIG